MLTKNRIKKAEQAIGDFISRGHTHICLETPGGGYEYEGHIYASTDEIIKRFNLNMVKCPLLIIDCV